MTEAAETHAHWFSAFPCQLGPYGPQDVHLHHCIEGEPGDCDDAIAGLGRDCGGRDTPHEHMTLTEHGLQPAEALARLRAAVPVAAIPEPPCVYSFTRDQLIAALKTAPVPGTLEMLETQGGAPEDLADAIIQALESAATEGAPDA